MAGFDDLGQRRSSPGATPTVWDVVWTYDLHASLTPEQWSAMERRLHHLLEELSPSAENAAAVQAQFDAVVRDLESVTGGTLDEAGVVEYGGLNEFFGEIMRRYGFPVEQDAVTQRSDFVYPGSGRIG